MSQLSHKHISCQIEWRRFAAAAAAAVAAVATVDGEHVCAASYPRTGVTFLL